MFKIWKLKELTEEPLSEYLNTLIADLITNKISREELVKMLEISYEQYRYQKSHYWDLYLKLVVLILVVLAIPYFASSLLEANALRFAFPIVAIVLSTYEVKKSFAFDLTIHHPNCQYGIIKNSIESMG